MSEQQLRQLWYNEYCNPSNPIYTFDEIRVKFYPENFNHAFFESSNWAKMDKSALSLNRCEKCFGLKIAFRIEQQF